MIYILYKVACLIKRIAIIIFRNRAVDQTIFFKIAVQKPCYRSHIPDCSGPDITGSAPFCFSSCNICQIITKPVFSL